MTPNEKRDLIIITITYFAIMFVSIGAVIHHHENASAWNLGIGIAILVIMTIAYITLLALEHDCWKERKKAIKERGKNQA